MKVIWKLKTPAPIKVGRQMIHRSKQWVIVQYEYTDDAAQAWIDRQPTTGSYRVTDKSF